MQQEKNDVVVIGSGIGGLCTGALLARKGYKTLVVEKRPHIGGRCSTEEIEGFRVATGAIAIHPGAGMGDVFREVGTKLELVMVPKLYWRIEGEDHQMPAKGSISVMMDIINRMESDRAKLVGGLAKAVAAGKIREAMGRGFRDPEKETLMFRDWLLQYTDNKLAHDVFDCIVVSLCGGHSYEMPASSAFSWFAKMGGARDVGVPPHGPLVEMQKLEKVVKDNNGDVWTNCPARRIVVEKGRARGVVVQKDGSEVEIAGQVVVSDVGPKGTVELAGEENFDEKYMRMLRIRIKPSLNAVAWIAGDRPLWPESGEPAILQLIGTRRVTSVIPFSSVSPDFISQGQHLTFVLAHPVTSFGRIDPEEEERQVLLDLEEQFPGWQEHGRIIRFTVNDADSEFVDARGHIGFMMPHETPVKNLYNAGDATSPYGTTATTGCALSAKQLAETIMKSFKPGKA